MNATDYAKRKQFYTDGVTPLLSDYLDRSTWNTCLDLGCGDGSLLNALEKQGYLAGKSVYAIDLSKSRIDLVKKINKDFACLVRDVCDTKLESGSIDFLLSTQVIEHVEDDTGMVGEIHRILAAKGTVYLSTVFKKWYGWYFYRCNGKWTLDPTHVREYTQDGQMVDLFRKYDFKILENKKTLDGRPVLDSIMRRIGAGRNVYDNRLLRMLRAISIPIPGYYIWEIVCVKS
jgi:2-polyprenyl-3-methyl-5-hydroxy-6-metoxy-1,4-benzoquinol methylase